MFIHLVKRVVFSFVFFFKPSNEEFNMATIVKPEKKINIVFGSKGGIGKSFVAALQCQTYRHLGIAYVGIDMDPANPTLGRFESLSTEVLGMMNKDNSAVNQGAFDSLVDRCYTDEMAYVLDIGSNAYLAMASYLQDGAGFKLLVENGYEVTIHIVVAGGQDLTDCLQTIKDCVTKLDGKIYNFVIWLNEYQDEIVHNDKKFEDFKLIVPIYPLFKRVVIIPKEGDLRRAGIQQSLLQSETFADAKKNPKVNIVMRQRLNEMELDYLKIGAKGLGLILKEES